MKGPRLIFFAIVCLWLAGGFQQGLAPRLIPSAPPDFFLVTVTVLGLLCSRRGGAVLGFSAGMVEGSLAGANLTAYVLTRAIAGFAVASITGLEFEPTPFVVGALTFLITLGAQLGLMFISPPAAILPFVLATIGTAVANAVLAMPLHMLIRRFTNPYGR